MTDPSTPTPRSLTARERVLRVRDAMDRPSENIAGSRPEQIVASVARFLKIVYLEFRDNAVWQRAATLTYTTILSLFPLMVLLTALGSAFYTEAKQDELMRVIQDRLMPPSDAGILTTGERDEVEARRKEIQAFIDDIRERSDRFRKSAGSLGAVGFLGLLITGFMLYRTIESSFERSWETGVDKPLWRTIAGFALLVLFAPIILGISITASSFLVAKIEGGQPSTPPDPAPAAAIQLLLPRTDDSATSPPLSAAEAAPPDAPRKAASALVKFALSLANPLFNGFMLALAYTYIPQARVRFRYAIVGGIAAGVAWEFAKAVFFYYILTSATQRSVIQSLGAVPFFLIWIYFTWIVFLGGNELTCVLQNYSRMVVKHLHAKAVRVLDGRVYVTIMAMVGERFEQGDGGIPRESLARMVRMMPRMFDDVVDELVRRGFLAEAANNRLLLARPAEKIALKELLSAGCDPMMLCEPSAMRTAAGNPTAGMRIDTGGMETLADLLKGARPTADASS